MNAGRGTKAVLFDYGLTLVTFDFPSECLRAALERFRPQIAGELGRPAPAAADLLTSVLEPVEEMLAGLGEDEVRDYLDFYGRAWAAAGLPLSRPLLHAILDAEQRCWDAAVRLAPGAFGVLEGLRERGVRTAVCSNAPFPPDMMRRQLAGNGLAERLDAIVFSSEIGRRKPAPEPYRAALDAVGAEPAATLHVGDRYLEDYEGPRRLGIRAVICTALARSPVPPGTPVIDSLAAVLDLL